STPMTPIVGYCKLLIDQELGPLSTPQIKALKAMDDCVQRLRGLIDNLLDVTGMETGRMRFANRDYDLVEVVAASVQQAGAGMQQKKLNLFTDLPKLGTLAGFGDPLRVRRAVDQLIDNAVKFTPPQGKVGIRARRLASGHFEVCVADSGPG